MSKCIKGSDTMQLSVQKFPWTHLPAQAQGVLKRTLSNILLLQVLVVNGVGTPLVPAVTVICYITTRSFEAAFYLGYAAPATTDPVHRVSLPMVRRLSANETYVKTFRVEKITPLECYMPPFCAHGTLCNRSELINIKWLIDSLTTVTTDKLFACIELVN